MAKTDIDGRYLPSEEIRRDESPYIEYLDCLERAVDFSKVDGVCDLGCATGALIKHVRLRHPSQRVYGVEYFAWQRDAADPATRECIELHDLRDPFEHNVQYDIVNCTEVGEHIDPEFVPVLMATISKLCRQHLIMTWSRGGGSRDPQHDPHQQHLNPMDYGEYLSMVEGYGFRRETSLTNRFLDAAKSRNKLYHWWLDSIMFFSPSKESV